MTTTLQRVRQLAAEVNKVMGADSLIFGSDPRLMVSFIPTGVFPVDAALDGGIPRGRITEIYGDYSTLKSLIATLAIIQVQLDGGVAALVDSEHSFDEEWFRYWGGDPSALLIQRPDTGEDAVKITDTLVRAGVDLIVWDSVAALQPQSYANAAPGSSEEDQPAGLARLMSRGLRRINSGNKTTAILLINQTRSNIGMSFGPKEANPGGKAIGYYASYRIRLQRAGKLVENKKTHDGEKMIDTKVIVAQKIKMTLEKSKLSRPLAETWFLYDHKNVEIDEIAYLMSQGIEQGWVVVKGAWFSLPYYQKGIQGRENFKDQLTEDDIEWMKIATIHGPMAAERFRGDESLGPVDPPVKSKAARPKPKTSSDSEPERTRTRAQATSRKTGPTKTTSTKSRTRQRLRSR